MNTNEIIGKEVILNDDNSFVGIIVELYLLADPIRYRKYDLWRVLWNTGKTGVIELKDITFIN